MRAELGEEAVADIEGETRASMLTECESEETTAAEIQCMHKATSLDQLSSCEKAATALDDDVHAQLTPEGDPEPVPFIDDIWPNTKATGAGSGKPDPSVNYAVGLGLDPQVRGPANALVTIVMFGDFQCPYCKRSLGTLDEVMAKHGKDVRLVFRHNPLPGHAQAREAAKAALAAAKQDKFWPFHDKMFDNQSTLLEVNFVAWATALSLEVPRFERDLADRLSDTQIDEDIAEAAKFGANFTPSFFVNGRFLSGAQPLHKFEALIEEERARAKTFVERRGNTRKGLYEDMISRFASGVTKPPTAPAGTLASGKRYTVETTDLPRKGTSGIARVEIVECSDFDCPFCKRVNPTMDKIVKEYSSSVALYWLHNPISSHPGAEPAARAATAAANQGKFWEMHAKLFEDTALRSKSDFDTMARDLGLDMAEFSRDYDATETKELVVKQQKICTDNDARGTPAFFINGRLVSGAQPYDRFKEVIDEELSGGI
ncbi:MAG: thioredoxin domain-containing protein [Nannocystaceae bacterium]|nr:thioredoxin domain-containing protein [Nannocystaceae bacterium]